MNSILQLTINSSSGFPQGHLRDILVKNVTDSVNLIDMAIGTGHYTMYFEVPIGTEVLVKLDLNDGSRPRRKRFVVSNSFTSLSHEYFSVLRTDEYPPSEPPPVYDDDLDPTPTPTDPNPLPPSDDIPIVTDPIITDPVDPVAPTDPPVVEPIEEEEDGKKNGRE